MAPELLFGVSTDGAKVAEAELEDGDPIPLVEAARSAGAELLWIHSNADLAPLGFACMPGYVRLRAGSPPAGRELPRLAAADYAATLDRAYRGLWGHKQVAPDAVPPDGTVVVGLYEVGEPVGLCTVFPAERLVDSPGVVPGAREAPVYAQLLRGACAVLGSGPVELDSWGDAAEVIEAYAALGFEPVARVAGWELRLRS